MTDEDRAEGSEARTEALLGIVRDMAYELHPERRQHLQLTLTSDLDRDLGFDSLARIELLRRINQVFRVDVGEAVLETAETPGDLLAALTGARPHRPGVATAERTPLEAVASSPAAAATLIEVLGWHASEHPDRPHVRLLEADGSISDISHGELRAGAGRVAAGLRDMSLLPGSHVAIMLPTSADYLYCFFGVLMAGGVPVPIYPPARASQIEEHLRRHAGILDNARTPLLITVERARRVARLLEARVPDLARVASVAELTRTGVKAAPAKARAADVAFLQYTSGSTGDPKGVVLTHANLLANIRAMGEAIEADSRDVFVSWLPLYHDMGLI
ncbi:MAG: AMP-binding protein, partial [Pseudomonadota bacterium]